MSFDIIVVKLRRKVTSLLDVTEGDVEPLGTPIEIRQSCLKLFPPARLGNGQICAAHG
jgi:hypothetical protein